MTKLVMIAIVGCMLGAVGCVANSQDDSSNAVAGDEANVTSDATLKLTSDFTTSLVGHAKAGGALRVEYALERLPQCRGNVGGGGPGWTITGYYSENGAAAKTFDVSELSADGKDRVAKPARITLSQGGDLALWFQVTSRFGCSEYDSAFGQNFHVDVEGAPPQAGATITFAKDGAPSVQGQLKAGGKAKVHYEQDRLPQCRRTQAGNPLWSISGFSSINGGEAKSFATGRPEGSDREEIDAVIDLDRSGELALWFEVTSVGGCHEVDSSSGQNYRFHVE